MIKNQTYRHVCVDFADGCGIGIRTLASIEEFLEKIKNPKCWKNGKVPIVVRAWVEWW